MKPSPARPPKAEAVRTALFGSVIVFSLSVLWLCGLLVFAQEDVAKNEIGVIILFCLAVLFVQALLVLALYRWARILLPLLGVINTYSLYFVFSSDLIGLHGAIQFFLLVAIFFLYYAVIDVSLRVISAHRAVLAVFPLAAVLFGGFGILSITQGEGRPNLSEVNFKHIQIVEFAKRPNVYFLGFDALIPSSLGQKLLGIDHLPYIDVISRHGGKLLPNMFANTVPTRWYWATVMNIIPDMTIDRDAAVSGRAPSPLLSTFLSNNYDTHLVFWASFFGPQGAFLTTYSFPEEYSTCSFLGDLPKRFGLLGYCRLRDATRTTSRKAPEAEIEEFYLQQLRSITRGNKRKPQFLAMHYPYPNHTTKPFTRSEEELRKFRERYTSRSEIAAQAMDKMLTEIRTADPSAVVFIFGDHGSWISRGLGYAHDLKFLIQDRHGVLGAVFGAEDCMHILQSPEGKAYHTVSRTIIGLLQCLAGGKSPLKTDYDFGVIVQSPNGERFENYAYE